MIKQLISTSASSVKIDWERIESYLGFTIHNNIKDFYSRIVVDDKCGFKGRMKFVREKFIIQMGNDKYDRFLFNNGNTNDYDEKGNDTYYYLKLLSSNDLEDLPKKFEQLFNMEIWQHIYNMGKRVYIGSLMHKAGDVSLFINNDSGVFEWAFLQDKYQNYYDNPNGIVAYNAHDFILKLSNKLE